MQLEFWDHLSVHYSADKLYRCDRCPFRTPLKHHMTSHRMNHDDDKPFSCDLCSYRAVSQSMVNSHKKSHSTVRPYACDFPRCRYATKFVNQLTRHRDKQHPGWTSTSPTPTDGATGRRRRPSASVPPPPVAVQLGYPAADDGGVLPPSQPPLPAEVTAPAMLPWSIPAPPPWSPFHFLQRMAAAAAVSGLPLCPPASSPLAGPRPVDLRPPPSTLPRSQSLDVLPGPTSTPQKPPAAAAGALGGHRDVLAALNSPRRGDVDVRSSFLARLAVAAAIKASSLVTFQTVAIAVIYSCYHSYLNTYNKFHKLLLLLLLVVVVVVLTQVLKSQRTKKIRYAIQKIKLE